MISWLAAAIDGNEERGKMQMDIQKAASHGGGGGGEDWWRGERGPTRDRGRWTYTKRHHMVGGGTLDFCAIEGGDRLAVSTRVALPSSTWLPPCPLPTSVPHPPPLKASSSTSMRCCCGCVAPSWTPPMPTSGRGAG